MTIFPEEEHYANRETLATYLLAGHLQALFDMAEFCEADRSLFADTCGSVGCAIGHGPYAGVEKHAEEDWDQYSHRVFGLELAAWAWCFSSRWRDTDNTPEGAALRIRWLHAHGVPQDWYEQSHGIAPLCYRAEGTPR
jgi:hypothetical protein